MEKKGSATWTGDLKSGQGHLSTESGLLREVPYGFDTRFEGAAGTNPEELIGAAHAACFSMALSMILGEHGATPEEITATSTVTLNKEGEGFAIKRLHLDLTAKVPGLDEAAFRTAADAAKDGCPVSKLCAGAEITMDARLA
ncbi:OsmC family protein [Rhodovulum sp. ES.010]|uniref:OsmC family protein n=1 Tax=Rhodovulum sp. ES.010 TaxID=1882821 RepID=UPI0009418099|nr:OsmC family protein [Rhodovulum sp. ES.010]